MAEIIAADIPFKKIECHTADAIEVFREQGMFDKIELLKTTHELYTQYHTLDGLVLQLADSVDRIFTGIRFGQI